MGLSVNTNTPSLIAQTSLSRATSGLERSMQRLSTGYRIGSARDDAAGLQIANRMTSQINGLTVALRNASDSLSVTQTVEGALGEYTQILQRMRDLALQAASDSNGRSERQALEAEVSQLKAELDRIAETTSFGANKLLDGSYEGKSFQVGANSCETVSLSVPSMATEGIKTPDMGTCADTGKGVRVKGWEAFSLGGVATTTVAVPVAQTLTFMDVPVVELDGEVPVLSPFTVEVKEGDSATTIAKAINDHADNGKRVVATAKNKAKLVMTAKAGAGDVAASPGETVTLTVNDTNSFDFSVKDGEALVASNALKEWASAINDDSKLGVRAIVEGGALILESASGDDLTITVAESDSSAMMVASAELSGFKSDGSEITPPVALTFTTGVTDPGTVKGYIEFHTSEKLVAVASSVADAITGKDADVALTGEAGVLSLRELTVLNAESAQQAIAVLDYAINFVDTQRGCMGAMQNRVEHTVYNLQNIRQNMSASRGRLVDADYASEVAEMTRLQILKQASIATVVQANEQARDVLQLLRW